jgi:mannose-P-dolichol utilization defect protein 1
LIIYFSAWGEGLFLAVQTVSIATLVLHFNVTTLIATSFLAIYVGVFSVLVNGMTPVHILLLMQTSSIPIMVIGKVRVIIYFIS